MRIQAAHILIFTSSLVSGNLLGYNYDKPNGTQFNAGGQTNSPNLNTDNSLGYKYDRPNGTPFNAGGQINSPTLNTDTTPVESQQYNSVVPSGNAGGQSSSGSALNEASVHQHSSGSGQHSHSSSGSTLNVAGENQHSSASAHHSHDAHTHGHHHDATSEKPMNYEFEYTVNDESSANFYGHTEKRDNFVTTGRYYVYLPDGRLLMVSYYADKTGYHPTITYAGEAQYPESQNTQASANTQAGSTNAGSGSTLFGQASNSNAAYASAHNSASTSASAASSAVSSSSSSSASASSGASSLSNTNSHSATSPSSNLSQPSRGYLPIRR